MVGVASFYLLIDFLHFIKMVRSGMNTQSASITRLSLDDLVSENTSFHHMGSYLKRNNDKRLIVEVADKCVLNGLWDRLQALLDDGFDITENHLTGYGVGEVCETLLHRCVRMFHDKMSPQFLNARVEKLLEMGADPNVFSRQGFSVMGLLCYMAKSASTNKEEDWKSTFLLLENAGVDITSVCGDGSSWANVLELNKTPLELLSKQNPKLEAWVQERILMASTKTSSSKVRRVVRL